MTGIVEIFAEFACYEADEFQMVFAFERERRIRLARQRYYSERTRMRVNADPDRRGRRQAYMRGYMRDYDRRRRAEDPAYLEMRRKAGREAMRRLYARRRAEGRAA